MTEKQLNKAVELNEQRKKVKIFLRDIESEGICIYVGTSQRLDILETNYYDRIKSKIVNELKEIHEDLNKKITEL